jgi:hypothetical protein
VEALRFGTDFVAKVGEEQPAGNNRIGTDKFLNQHCALAPVLASMLLAQVRKIVLQHNRSLADYLIASIFRPQRIRIQSCPPARPFFRRLNVEARRRAMS